MNYMANSPSKQLVMSLGNVQHCSLPAQSLKFLRMRIKLQTLSCRRMKNPEKLAASKKTPLVAEWCFGKIRYVRADPSEVIAPEATSS
jgi:23S rRNA C2498 (ribose-2'-O)-methylase RlmM